MDTTFKIGEVAAMFDVSIRALRLYDKIGLFQPEYKDPSSGYRYYTADQMQRLDVIIALKAIGCKLSQIKKLFDDGVQSAKLQDLLEKEEAYWNDQIEIAKYKIENIRLLKKATIQEADRLQSKKLDTDQQAFAMSRLICLNNLKLESYYSETLWL